MNETLFLNVIHKCSYLIHKIMCEQIHNIKFHLGCVNLIYKFENTIFLEYGLIMIMKNVMIKFNRCLGVVSHNDVNGD
jgi:hypothetical protein